MHGMILAGLALAWGGGARAASELAFAPPPDWVRPAAVPADTKPADEAALRVLLLDEQYDLTPDRRTRYAETVFRIQTPQGLPAGGATFAWNPETQAPTVHKLLIRRGGETIDVLKSGQRFTVVRREANLENAVIDGVLTATIQPEGLQVGDVIDFAVSIADADPALAGHAEAMAAAWNGAPIARAHLAARWPQGLAMRLRGSGGQPTPRPARQGGFATIELSADDVQPVPPPNGAPPRFAQGRLIELTDLASWGAMAARFAPLFDRAATFPATGPLADEVARIRAASPDPVARAEAVLALVQDRVRYVALFLNDGGLLPADAATTWGRRFGDCKGKTALLVGLLRAMGIEAVPVLVGSAFGDGLDARLPAVGLFNHVLVRATIAGRTYWLDGTRVGDTRLAGIRTPDFRWGLPLAAGTTALVPMRPEPLDRPQTEVAIRIDARGGITLPAPVHVERVVRGDEAVGTNLALGNIAGAARDQALRAFWKKNYDFVAATAFSNRFDPATRTLTMTVDGTTKMEWNGAFYEADGVGIGWKADFARAPGPDRDAPFAVGYPSFTRTTETILLPPGAAFTVNAHESDVDETVAGIRYHRASAVKDATFTVVEEDRALAPEFPASEAPAAETRLRALAKTAVYLKIPESYQRTEGDLKAALATTPTTAAEFLIRGNDLLNAGHVDEALPDLDRSLALDPRNASAHADRGIALQAKGNIAGAKAEVTAARAINPDNPAMLRLDAVIAAIEGDPRRALDLYTRSLRISPDNITALSESAIVALAVGDSTTALANLAAVKRLMPGAAWPYRRRIEIYHSIKDRDGAVREAEAALRDHPDVSLDEAIAANAYLRLGRRDEALGLLNRAIARKPEPYLLLDRADARDAGDRAGRLADMAAALALDPAFTDAAIEWSDLLKPEERADAIAALTKTIASAASDARPWLLARRGLLYARAGDATRADQDLSEARNALSDADALTVFCRMQGLADVGLATGLAACDAALAAGVNTARLNARGLLLLRQGREAEAIASYDKALALDPYQIEPLFGRALANKRRGDAVSAARDLASARNVDPFVESKFAVYGLSL